MAIGVLNEAPPAGMQTASTNICERSGRSQELPKIHRGAVPGHHMCSESSHEIATLLNIPQSTVGGVTTMWKQQQQLSNAGIGHVRTESIHLQTSCGLLCM